jgi:hypothetical protein
VVERFRECAVGNDETWLYRLKPRHNLRDAGTGRYATRVES